MKLESFRPIAPVIIIVVLTLAQPTTSFAYVGPGAGLSIIGSLLAFFAAIIVGIFGFLWFPIRRILRKRKQAKEQALESAARASDGSVNDRRRDEAKPGEVDA